MLSTVLSFLKLENYSKIKSSFKKEKRKERVSLRAAARAAPASLLEIQRLRSPQDPPERGPLRTGPGRCHRLRTLLPGCSLAVRSQARGLRPGPWWLLITSSPPFMEASPLLVRPIPRARVDPARAPAPHGDASTHRSPPALLFPNT